MSGQHEIAGNEASYSENEKHDNFLHIENEKGVSMTPEEAFFESFSEKDRKILLLKMDLHILPILIALYLLSFIDRANIGNAKIEGLTDDLNLTGNQYNIVLSTFFVTYIIFEIPSNYVLERYFKERPSWWLGFIATVWGVVMTLHGIVQNYGQITAVRLIMGAFEAGLFPGAIIYMNNWYSKYELATRFSLFYVGSALSGAFSGLLAFSFAKLNGVAGDGSSFWRYVLFLVYKIGIDQCGQGILTVLAGVLTFFALPDTPEHATRWLSDDQRKYLRIRKNLQNGGVEVDPVAHRFSWRLLWTVITDWQFYIMAFNFWSNNIPTYGLKFSLPQILTNMGNENEEAQLLTIPPYIAGAISAYCFGRLSDKFKRRSLFLIIPQTLLIITYAVLTPLSPHVKNNVGACYFAIVLACIGLYPINPGSSSWISNNLAGPNKRALGIAYVTSLTNLGGIGASYIFIDSEAPGYPTGFGTSLAFAISGLIASVLLDVIYIRINKKRDEVPQLEIVDKYSTEELAELGDRSPLFRYTL
ncbi:major facilitator superfamily domain-containing protein [Xylaria arbuscula]|nr:major facilitator superfamily domain-containing protein [Xylaria arbuscula]